MRGLSLRSRLSFAFALLALVPLAAVVPFAVRNLRRTLSTELQTRADAALASAHAHVELRCREARHAVEELLDSAVLEDLARRARSGAPPAESARRAMEARGLGVLAVLSDEGRTLSSGHLPARFLDLDPPLRHLAEAARGVCRIDHVTVPQPSGLTSVPAIISGGLFEYGEARLWVLAGARLDEGFVEPLSLLTGAQVALRDAQGVVAVSGPTPARGTRRTLELAPGLTLELTLDGGTAREAEQGLTLAFFLLAALGLVFAGGLGLFLSQRLTRPLEALTQGARAVAAGSLDTSIAIPASGEVGELLFAFNQMTENLKTATEQKVAAERVAAWQEIAKNLAHELKNPLTPIQLSLETLAAASKSDHPRFREMFQESASAMLEEVDRLRRTVDAFSRFARLPKPVLGPLDLAEVARQVLAIHGALPSHVQLRAELDTPIPIQGDRDQLTQVVVNLLGNAREALAERGGEIRVRAASVSGEAMLEVSDTGPGIPLEHRGRLFEPYFTTKVGGTGLGLAIASRIAQEHGGRLELDAAAPPGARFRLILPERRTAS